METLHYIKTFLKDRNVASITPTSKSGVKNVCTEIDFSRDVTVVEYGAATGVFTRFLLRQATPGSRVVAIEKNPDLHACLGRRLRDPRLSLVCDSAENVGAIMADLGLGQADYVISGIPFMLFSDALKNSILENTRAVLREGGKFLLYQTFWQGQGVLMRPLCKRFARVESRFELRNIPPLRIYQACK